MKKFLVSLLIVAVLVFGWACAKSMPHLKTDTSHHTNMAQNMPCCPTANSASDAGTMLVQDCMMIDFQQAGNPQLLKKMDASQQAYSFAYVAVLQGDTSPAGLRAVREPPDLRPVLATFQPVYLATLRLRI